MEGQNTESKITQSVTPQTSTVSPISQTLPPERKSSRLKSKLPWIIIIILLVLVGIFGGYFVLNQMKQNQTPTPAPDQKACSQEAKICPDGSGVGREGPNCEFAACPATPASSSADTSNWKTYSGDKFTFKYPQKFYTKETDKNFIVLLSSPNEYAQNSDMSLDARLSNINTDYDKSVKSMEDSMTNLTKSTIGNWIMLKGIGDTEGPLDGQNITIAFFKVGNTAVSADLYSGKLTEFEFKEILKSFIYSN